ncbi:hypothetical protein NMG60_11005406 [Bertholletia excelsa]
MDDHYRHLPDYSPLLIGLLGVLCGAAIVATFHCLCRGCCSPRRPAATAPSRPRNVRTAASRPGTTVGGGGGGGGARVSAAAQHVAVYKRAGAGDEGMCAVCLGEFVEGEELRVLPGCTHCFHVSCVDTWLRSHSSCPLCRAVAPSPPARPPHVAVSI